METLQMRTFNPEGINQMRTWLDQARINPSTPVPLELLTSGTFSEAKGNPIDGSIFSDSAFETKLTLAKAIDDAIQMAALDEGALENDQGFWSWLTLQFASRFIGLKGMGESALWIYEPGNWRKVYRQKMAPLWLAYRAHRENPECLKAVLGIPVNKTGEVFEQMMARKWIVLSPGIMTLVTRLYFDEAQRKLKKGSGGKDAGAPRRLSTVLDQLGLTYDIEELGWEALASMLPKDFLRFSPSTTA
ncbi:TPA: hypothetical protein ACHP3V_006030 [Pseudomonas aeruginosa]|uniref:hypothetical protein n=1 Tax=Pseudomonas aeruginosa TaxID=287 RepID=UPI0003B9DC61|nr:hypothetical protein [Pseudomonas aeruginosa]ERY75306.1 hypothetical protein Q029_02135 [Pseudomonas aeruginosa BWHPSA016]MBI7254139.1 hypothetical protein [Pseudomonas aeruginosa]MCS7788633.1 hypothetical protein [Pseudomonas aeruginosa]MCV0111372.1 hypothetical protein [Pseudomonas aeruginosa]MCV0117254.1 hypothetical protein [Pseudomonas aeruginosa]